MPAGVLRRPQPPDRPAVLVRASRAMKAYLQKSPSKSGVLVRLPRPSENKPAGRSVLPVIDSLMEPGDLSSLAALTTERLLSAGRVV